MTCYCYIIECADGSLYTGWTTDPVQRVRKHNAGRGAVYTRLHRPVVLVYTEPQPSRSTAQTRENRIKKMRHEQKVALIQSKDPTYKSKL